MLRRLDRLTQDEARITVAQTLSVVHGLVSNMKVVMEGTCSFLDGSFTCYQAPLLDGKASIENIQQALGMGRDPGMGISVTHLHS